MNSNLKLSRRRFMANAALTGVVGNLLPGVTRLDAAASDVGETDHFWYRLAPVDGPYIDTQRGHQAIGIGIGDGKLYFSEDNAATWPHIADFPDAANLTFSCILENGNIVFATRSKLFLSTDQLKTHRELTIVDRDGGDYLPHTPRDVDQGGWYFYSLDGVHTHRVDGREILIWGNYCNVRTEPVPANIYYSTDGGETVKIAYSFGQNPDFQYPDADPAAWLGAADNPVVCRHIHSVTYNAPENAFYACTGDLDRGHGKECHWLRGRYDATADSWDWQVLVSADANSRYKSGGINCVDGQIYWVADANGPKTLRETYDRGIFRCDPADLANPDKHTKIFDAQYEMAIMTIDDGVIVAPQYGSADPCDCGFLFSPDLGKTWGQYDLKEFGDRSGVRVNPRNSDGWFRVGLRKKWLERGEVLFIKPKT